MELTGRKIEIFGTLGPACGDADTLAAMLREGMTGVRLNLSHAGLAASREMLENYRSAQEICGVKTDLLIDLQGPELRIGMLPQPVELRNGEEILFIAAEAEMQTHSGDVSGPEGGTDQMRGWPEHSGRTCAAALQQAAPQRIPLPAQILAAMEKGDIVYLDDCRIEAKITEIAEGDPDCATGRVLRGGTLSARKSIKIRGKKVSMPALTREDMENLRCAGEYGVTAVMLPFVTSGGDIRLLRSAMEMIRQQTSAASEDAGNSHFVRPRIFAKIENREGVGHLEDIIPEADMIVIARGDLGNDLPLWELPAVQKQISEKCRGAGRDFLVVTQMLTSMISHPVPTRAEVSDIYNALCDGAAAIMVTNETAVGQYPAEVIRYMRKVTETITSTDRR